MLILPQVGHPQARKERSHVHTVNPVKYGFERSRQAAHRRELGGNVNLNIVKQKTRDLGRERKHQRLPTAASAVSSTP